MKTITFTQEQLKNLGIFLARVQLTGAEVGAFQDIIRALAMAEELTDNKKNGKVDPGTK